MLAQEQFKVLTTSEQAAILRSHGNYIHYRIKGWCKIELYWFHKFYVEVWYLHNDQTIGLIRILPGKPSLEPYLDTIQIKIV